MHQTLSLVGCLGLFAQKVVRRIILDCRTDIKQPKVERMSCGCSFICT
jgi:hypothetical protein